jgi:hypothetical protein
MGKDDMGSAITAADTYRRYAAECVMMSSRSRNAEDKAVLMGMAEMWLRLADFLGKREADSGAASVQAASK